MAIKIISLDPNFVESKDATKDTRLVKSVVIKKNDNKKTYMAGNEPVECEYQDIGCMKKTDFLLLYESKE